jgi:hypothetical protein
MHFCELSFLVTDRFLQGGVYKGQLGGSRGLGADHLDTLDRPHAALPWGQRD